MMASPARTKVLWSDIDGYRRILPENRFHWSAEHQLGSDLICVHPCPSVVKIGFEMALFGFVWLCLALFGFVFYRQNCCFASVKSGDSSIFKMGLFRNFMFFSQVTLRPGTRTPWCLKFLWMLELGRLERFLPPIRQTPNPRNSPHPSFLILNFSFILPPILIGRLDNGCPTQKIILRPVRPPVHSLIHSLPSRFLGR